MLCPRPFATGSAPAFMATDLPFASSWMKALVLPLGPGNLSPVDECTESLGGLSLAYRRHPNRTPEEIYSTLTAILADCPRCSPKLINMTSIPIKTMVIRSAPSMEDRHHTPHRNLETKMRMWLTARPVTQRRCGAWMLSTWRGPRCRGINRSRKPRSWRESERRRRPS